MTLPLGFAENSIQLVPDGTLLLHILIILVMVYVLNATLFKPINRILQRARFFGLAVNGFFFPGD